MPTGQNLISWGYTPGKWFAAALAAAAEVEARGGTEDEIKTTVARFAPGPKVPLRQPGELSYHRNLTPENADDAANLTGVELHMRELMRVPTICAGAVMPDACPAGHQPGTNSSRWGGRG